MWSQNSWSLNTGEISVKKTLLGVWKGGLLTQVVLRTSSIVCVSCKTDSHLPIWQAEFEQAGYDRSLVAQWAGQQLLKGHEMFSHDPEVMGSNLGQVELRVSSSSKLDLN